MKDPNHVTRMYTMNNRLMHREKKTGWFQKKQFQTFLDRVPMVGIQKIRKECRYLYFSGFPGFPGKTYKEEEIVSILSK